MSKKTALKLPLPKVWDRIELIPLEMPSVTPLSLRVAELLTIDNAKYRFVLTAPEVRASGPFSIGNRFLLRYNVPNGVVEAKTTLLVAEDQTKVRHWLFEYPDTFTILQRRTSIRVSVYLNGEIDLVHESMSEKRIAQFLGSVTELSVAAAVMTFNFDTDNRLSARAKVYFRFSLPEIGPMGELSARVLRVQKIRVNMQIQTIVTIQFVKMPNVVEKALAEYCKKREKFLLERLK